MFSLATLEVKGEEAFKISFSIISAILPPYWFIFTFARKTFDSYDTLTVLILSFSIGFC